VIFGVLFGVEHISGRKMFSRADRAQSILEESAHNLGLMSAVFLGVIVFGGCTALYLLYV